jgi:CelD/BcsL family acetyltransferase involved in cellulose biosynthesis
VKLDLSGSLRIEIADALKALLELRSDWLQLEVASGAELPFQTWEWAVAWWMHLRADQPAVRDHLRIVALRGDSERLVGVAPMVLTERPACGPIRARYLQFIGPDPHITEIGTMLCLPGFEDECWRTLTAYLGSRAADWDWINWQYPNSSTADCQSTNSAAFEPAAYVLQLPATWAELRAGLRRNIKESLRHCYNSLKRDGLQSRLEVAQTPADLDTALEDFFRLHTARARLTGVPRHVDVFAPAQARAFLIDVCRRLASRGACRIFRLRLGDQLVATRIGFELSGVLYLYYSGWDPAYARYSVMTTLVAEIVQNAIRRGLRSVHLSTGTDVSKTRWGPRQYEYVRRVEIAPRPPACPSLRLPNGDAGPRQSSSLDYGAQPARASATGHPS